MKKLSIRLLAIISILAFTTACHNGENEFQLTGTLENGAGKTIYIEELAPEGAIFIDSVRLDRNGSFSFKYDMPYESIYTVHVTPTDYIMLIPQGEEKINITGDYNRLSWTYKVTGSPESIMLWQQQMYTNDANIQMNELVDKLLRYDQMLANGEITQHEYDDERATMDSTGMAIYHIQQEYAIDMITNNPGTLVTLIAIHTPFNNQHFLIEPSANIEVWEQVLEDLETHLPENPHTLYFHNEVAARKAQISRQ